jgi:hypothetical protein
MKSVLRGVPLAMLALVSSLSAAAAQAIGLPVINSGIPTGIGVAGDVGFANNAYGAGTGYGLTGEIGFGRLGITATLGKFDPDGSTSSQNTWGATGNLKLFGGGLSPLSITAQAGYGHGELASTTVNHYPLGLGVALTLPLPVLSMKPWVAPRYDILHVDAYGTTSGTTYSDFGISGGIDFNFLMGLGFRVSYDWVDRNKTYPSIWGVGAKWLFRVPGL